MSDFAIGIDLGTTYSCCGLWDNDIKIINNDKNERTIPSWVNDNIVGTEAKESKNGIYAIKRLMGKKYSDIKDMNLLYSVAEGPNDSILVGPNKKTPIEISSQILSRLKEDAEIYSGKKISKAVITVPAYFNDSQRQATKDAGELAGLEVIRIINEPTAAAMAYGMATDKTILVFDLGGGTFDVSILKIDDDVYEVIATGGDTNLGGEDFDQCLINYVCKELQIEESILLKKKIEILKKHLSILDNIIFEYESHSLEISRETFENLCTDYFDKCLNIVSKVILDANMNKSDIDEVILIGGSTRIPKIRSMLKDFFGKDPNISINPDEAVAYGAAYYAAYLTGNIKGALLIDVTPLSLGIETAGGLMTRVIVRNTQIPIKKTQVFSTNADNQVSIEVKVFEGERGLVKDNNLLGSFKLTGIPPMPRGVPKIEITFSINQNGILMVSACEVSSGSKHTIEITKDKIDKFQVDKLLNNNKQFEEEDNLIVNKLLAKNELISLCYFIRDHHPHLFSNELITDAEKDYNINVYKTKIEELKNKIGK